MLGARCWRLASSSNNSTAAFVKGPVRNCMLAFALLALTTPRLVTAQETEHVTRTIKLDPGGTLRLKNFSGRVTVTASDQPDVVVNAVRRAPQRRLDRTRLDLPSEGSSVVVIDANRRDRSWLEFMGGSNVVETDLDIRVPRRTDLDIAVFSS